MGIGSHARKSLFETLFVNAPLGKGEPRLHCQGHVNYLFSLVTQLAASLTHILGIEKTSHTPNSEINLNKRKPFVASSRVAIAQSPRGNRTFASAFSLSFILSPSHTFTHFFADEEATPLSLSYTHTHTHTHTHSLSPSIFVNSIALPYHFDRYEAQSFNYFLYGYHSKSHSNSPHREAYTNSSQENIRFSPKALT